MSMKNTDEDFYGRQEGEKILYVVRPHSLATLIRIAKVYLVAAIVFLTLILIGGQLPVVSSLFVFLGTTLGLVIAVVGTKVTSDYQKRNISYITDRRIVHFEPTTLFATNSRSLSWDEAVKVKTYPPNVLWKQMAIGNVVVHARTPARGGEVDGVYESSVDDIELRDVYYYRDLGNYIDKILFTYKQKPREVTEIRPFVLKPRGERY